MALQPVRGGFSQVLIEATSEPQDSSKQWFGTETVIGAVVLMLAMQLPFLWLWWKQSIQTRPVATKAVQTDEPTTRSVFFCAHLRQLKPQKLPYRDVLHLFDECSGQNARKESNETDILSFCKPCLNKL